MKLNEYQKLAERTSNPHLSTPGRRINAILGLTGEAGEVAEYLKKVWFHERDLDDTALRAEIGDVLWYLAEICSAYGYDLETVAAENIAKLKARYPRGVKFT